VRAGQRWCIETARWRDAVGAEGVEVPRVKLDASHEEALKGVGLEELRKYAVEG